MKFKLEINMDNAAFGETLEDGRDELAAVINQAFRHLVKGDHLDLGTKYMVNDSNGNTVGKWEVSE